MILTTSTHTPSTTEAKAEAKAKTMPSSRASTAITVSVSPIILLSLVLAPCVMEFLSILPKAHAFSAQQLTPPWKPKQTQQQQQQQQQQQINRFCKHKQRDKATFARYTTTTTTTTIFIMADADAMPSSQASTPDCNEYDSQKDVNGDDAPRVFVAPSHHQANQQAHQTHTAGQEQQQQQQGETTLAATTLITSTLTSQDQTNDDPPLLSYLPKLWTMSRPSNFVGVVLFHTLGTYLAVNKSTTQLRSILLHPQQIIVLVALLLTSATSMVVNDYYDAKFGLDSDKPNKTKALPPRHVVKRFLGFAYAPLLLCTALVPGIPARISVLVGIMLTFLYTEHLKPKTWIKTVTCALLIALSPMTSGAAALALQYQAQVQAQQQRLDAVASLSTTIVSSSSTSSLISLSRLGMMLFFGFVGREILMDINDVVDDRLHRIKTVPVRYGRDVASRIALLSTVLMGIVCLAGAYHQYHQYHDSKRQLVLGLVGTVAQIGRAYQVTRTRGTSRDAVDKAVEEGKWTVMFLLASYL